MRRSRKIALGVALLLAILVLLAGPQLYDRYIAYVRSGSASLGSASAAPAGWHEALQSGKGAFLKPDELKIREWHSLTFLVGKSQRDLEDAAEGEELARPKPIALSRRMRVTLIRDPNFKIQPRTPSDLDLGADSVGLWQWDVKPLKEGAFELFAQVEVLKERSPGQFEPEDSYTRRVSVDVKVSAWERVVDGIRNATSLGDLATALFKSWEGALIALAALIAAAFGVRWAIRKGLRKPH